MRSLIAVLGIIGLILALACPALAGNTGKVVGRVVDTEKGDGLPGVNVIVVGTNPIRGATTDPDGNYTIIGVPIGTYTVRAQMVGYAPVNYNDVKITADATTSLNFKMTSSAVQLTDVTVTANKNLVNNMSTQSTVEKGAKEIESIPAVKSVEDVVKLSAGVVKQGNQIFLRGGRANEVQYVVDGVSANSVVGNSGLVATNAVNKQLADQYAGVSQGLVGNGGLQVSANAIQTISVQTSGFDADQGNAQSGIINIVTKSGGEKYSASAAFKTDRVGGDNQNETYSAFSLGGPEPLSKYVLPDLGIKIPGNLSFFINTDIDRNDGYAQFAHNEFYNPLKRRVQFDGFLGGIMNGLGFDFRDNQTNAFTFSSKINYSISTEDQVFYRYSASLTSNHGYDNDLKYRADSSQVSAGQSLNHVIQWQHFFGKNSFFRLYGSLLENRSGNDVAGLTPLDYSSAYKYLDVNADGFQDIGTSQQWYSALSRIWSMKFGYEGQVHPLHLLKAGFEFNYEEVKSTEIDYPTEPHTNSSLPDTNARYSRGLYPGYGIYRWNIDNYPNHGAIYLQDNIEFSGLNIHVGIRYDYFDIGRQVYYQDWIDAWKAAYYKGGFSPEQIAQISPAWVDNLGYEQQTDANGNTYYAPKGLKDRTRFLYYLTHGSFSPRLAIGYPVTERINFYFNYGHFLQFPDRDQYFKDPFIDQGGAVLGNPNLKTQRTVSYEAGFQDQFNDDMAFALHAFYKDIFDYATSVKRGDVYFMENLDFASARGFEITYNQVVGSNYSTSISYSYQIAKGRSSNPLQNVYQAEFTLPRETRLNWDQNHTVNVFATYKVSPQEEGKLFGMNNYGLSLTWSFGSGFPYNGYAPHQTAQYGLYSANSETAPYTSTFNLSLYKGLRVLNSLNMMLTLDILNLLDRKNPSNAYILPYTGRVRQYGDVVSGFDPNYPEQAVAYSWNSAEHDLLSPYRFEAPRQILLGAKLTWD
jgi:outer membrane receptor protein involved in Fe transport